MVEREEGRWEMVSGPAMMFSDDQEARCGGEVDGAWDGYNEGGKNI